MRTEGRLESPRELLRQLREASLKRRLLLLSGPLVAGILVLYHMVLFWDRVASQTLFVPQVALRWLATLILLGIAWRFRGAGVPLVHGRKALVFWLLVALLHLSFAGPLADDGLAVSLDGSSAALLLVLPATAAGAFVLALLLRYAGARLRHTGRTARYRRVSAGVPSRFAWEAGFMPSLCRKPPPA